MPQPLKPVGLEPVLCNKRSHPSEKPAVPQERIAMKSGPCSLQLEKVVCSKEDLAQPKINNFFFFFFLRKGDDRTRDPGMVGPEENFETIDSAALFYRRRN